MAYKALLYHLAICRGGDGVQFLKSKNLASELLVRFAIGIGLRLKPRIKRRLSFPIVPHAHRSFK